MTIRLSREEHAAWEAEAKRRRLPSLGAFVREAVALALGLVEGSKGYQPEPAAEGPQKRPRKAQKGVERALGDYLTGKGYAAQAAARFIRIGAVRVNGQKATDPFTPVTSADKVTIGGQTL